MAKLPHQFENLTSRNEKAVLMVGAGLSFGLVPMANKLLEIEQRATNKLGIEDKRFDDIDDPYKYADIALEHIPGHDKLQFVKSMGILDDPKWFAKVGLPLRGTTPRHRIIARFAREQLWHEIWSFNWDTVLESALEAVGFERGRQDGVKQPWNTLFDSLVTFEDLAQPSGEILKVYKPHGCLYAMKKAEELSLVDSTKSKKLADRFMIGNNELSNYSDWWSDEPGKTFLSQLHTSLNHFVIIVGWSVPEKYVHEKLTYIMNPIEGQIEHLSIIDPYYQDGHKVMSNRYKLNEVDVHLSVAPTQLDLSTDRLFLALQAKYSLKQLLEKTREDSLAYSSINDALNNCDLGNADESLLAWADDFLPAWVRLCWRSGLIRHNTFKAHDTRLEKVDIHIPYYGIEATRIDLEMAAEIFHLIKQSNQTWDFTTFPGGLWDYEKARLVIPLPNAKYNSLYALKPLIQMVEQKIGFIGKIVIMPITHQSIKESSNMEIRNAIQQVSSKPALWRDDFWKVTHNLIDLEEIT